MAQLLSAVTTGTLVKLNENGSPVEFYIAKHDYENVLNGSGRTLLVRKDVYQNGAWNASNVNTYANSTIGTWFNGTYKTQLDPWVQTAIGTTKFYYTPGNGDNEVTTLVRAVFALSMTELGQSNSNANVEGSALPIANTLKIAYQDGSATDQWLRTPYKDTSTAWGANVGGAIITGPCTDSNGYRPCFTLPSTLYFWDDGTVSQIPGPGPSSITISPIAMQNQPITVSWSSAPDADSYILQRKADSGEWEQVYAGSDLTFTDTAGSWSTVQYQVCGVFEGANGAFAQSDVITVLPASVLVISGTDGDLGTITSDIPYSVATDTGNQISLTRTVNGSLVASLTVDSGFAYSIPVMDLPTGTNTIAITATVETDSEPVTVTRTWTYTKAAASFPTSGGVAALSQDGQPIFPQTLAEAVKAIGGPWGGNLSTALDKLARAAVFNREVTPKYTKVNVDLSTAKSGDIVNLPVKGVMVTHIVVQVGNPDPEMYDSSCDGVWLLRQDIVGNGQWNSTGVNTLSGSTIMTAMQGYVTDYDSTVQAAIQTVKIPYCPGNGDFDVQTLGNGFECKMFPLGFTEFGYTSSIPQGEYLVADGACLQYFSGTSETDGKRSTPTATPQWSRTPYARPATPSEYVWYLTVQGGSSQASANTSFAFRPCFTLPTTFSATYYVDTQGTVHPSQEYTAAGDFYDLWGNVIPTVKIATGSYTGTGTYGSSNPNTLTFPFEPKFLLVQPFNTYSQNFWYMIWNFDVSGPICCAKNGAYDFASCTFSQNENTVSWYSDSAASQLNYDTAYRYFAIG